MAGFQIVTGEEGDSWPSGDHCVATLTTSRVEMERCIGHPLTDDFEDGIGEWNGIGLILASGRPVAILRYERAPNQPPDEYWLFADRSDDAAAVIAETLETLRFAEDRVTWRIDV